MNRTPEQQALVDAARADGKFDVQINSTTEQHAEWKKSVAVATAESPGILASIDRMEAARREPGFSGMLRRALAELEISPQHAARQAGVDPEAVALFCQGLGVLSSDVIDQLIDRLHLRLVLESAQ